MAALRIVLASALAVGCSSSKPPIAVPLEELLATSRTDLSAAKARFLGRTIDTAGNVTAINHDLSGALRVVLGDGPTLLKCYPTERSLSVVGRYPGDRVIIRGVVTELGPDVYVESCEVY